MATKGDSRKHLPTLGAGLQQLQLQGIVQAGQQPSGRFGWAAAPGTAAAGQRRHRGRPKFRSAGGPGISRDRGRFSKSCPDDRRHRIDRRAHREVHDAVRVRTRDGGDLRQGVPGEHRQRLRDPQQPAVAARPRRGRGVRRQSSSPLGGRSLTTCGSFSVSPTLEAPPGEPSSAKKSALIAVYCAHCSGTSSS